VPEPQLTVVICSLNGARGVERCLGALAAQTIAPQLEVVLVDDGSTDDTSAVGHAHGATVVRHDVNRGLSAARNSGVRAASAPIVAFLDDDCEPVPEFAERLLEAYEDGVVGVGGCVVPLSGDGLVGGYLRRNNPLSPLELELGHSESPAYRLRLYVRRMWSTHARHGRRDVYSLVGAGMSFRREALLDVGLFDERFTFGAEELDLCRRLARMMPEGRLVLEPAAQVVHEFDPSVRDMLRRSRAYGRGSARMYRKWPSASPTFFPVPIAVGALLAGATRRPSLALAALAAPHVTSPHGVRGALAGRDPRRLLEPYLRLAQETWEDVGFLEGLWAFRDLEAMPA
jgi:GT2 family glycosyltransferase